MSLAKAEALELCKEFGVRSLELIDALIAAAEEPHNSSPKLDPMATMEGLIETDKKLQVSLAKRTLTSVFPLL